MLLFAGVNSAPACVSISNTNILACMKKNRELEPWQKDDAARLHRAFDEYKKRTGKSQLVVANEIGWNTQATLHQYIKGKIPLNWKALKKLCDMSGERYDAISPTLAAENMVYAASSPPALYADSMAHLRSS